MEEKRSRLVWIILLAGLVILQVVHYWPLLPDRMATHFNGAGQPDGWSGKQGFFLIYIVTLIIMVVIFFGIRGLLSRTPDSLISLPKKKYWLAPERRAATLARLSDQLFWFGLATMGFFVGLFELTFRANLSQETSISPGVWILTGVYLAYTIVWTIWLILGFYRTGE